MTPNDLEGELTRLLTEQRRADEASAPGFHELLARARAGSGSVAPAPDAREGRWAWRAAIATAASLALAIGLSLLHRPQETPLPSNATAIAAWRAPTDVLLRAPGAELFSRLPVLIPSVPDGGANESGHGAREATPRSTQTKIPQTKGDAS